MRERGRDTEKEIFHMLIDSYMVTIIKFGADESQEPETLSTWVARVQILGLPSVLFPGIYTRNL